MALNDWAPALDAITNAVNNISSSLATGAQTKKQIREAYKYQLKLDQYAHERALANWNMENQYNEQMFLKYQTPEAQRRMLEEAGYAPELLAGSGSGGSAPASSGMTTIGSSQAPMGAPVKWDFSNLGENILNAMRKVEEIDALRDNKIARQYDIDARRIENNRKELEYFRELLDSSEDADRLAHERWKRGADQSAASRAQDAFEMEMRRIRQDLTHGVNEETRKQALFGTEMKNRELQYWLNQEDLTEKQWRRKYRDRYGRNPERNETVGDFLFKLSEDTGLLNLIGEVGSDSAGIATGAYRAIRNNLKGEDWTSHLPASIGTTTLRNLLKARMRERNSRK